MFRKLSVVAAVVVLALPTLLRAQDLVDSYVAVIGERDLYNSNGTRLTQPAQILRQDRANYHRFGIRQPGDDGDDLYGLKANRARMETLIQRGGLDSHTAQALVNGHAHEVLVRTYEGPNGQYIKVMVLN